MSSVYGVDTTNLVGFIAVELDPDTQEVALSVHEIKDRIPLERAVLAHYLRLLADRTDELDAELRGADS